MKYFDRQAFDAARTTVPHIGAFLDTIVGEICDYAQAFNDLPSHTSRWAHHYFCECEGGLLIYNPKDSQNHVCSICGRTYSNDLLNGAWYTMYRNHGAITAWKSALLHAATGDQSALEWLIAYVRFYATRYQQFTLHNKEGVDSKSEADAPWGSSRIMPQALNEGIFLVRLINALELVRDDLPDGFLDQLREDLFEPACRLFRPQVREIHNISAWLCCAIGVIGLFFGDEENVEFAFSSRFGVRNQLTEGVTDDLFWYEGSIHYNMFLLEGLVNLMLFSELRGHRAPLLQQTVAGMLQAAYHYAFDSHRLPNPNDGWPDVTLKTYSYIYAMAVKVLGESSDCGAMLKSILHHDGERGTIPLSKPYYFRNDVSLEEVIFTPGIRNSPPPSIRTASRNFRSSYCAIIKDRGTNIFVKYGHNGPSHAHPDKMNIEVELGGRVLSRDLSNSGYGNLLCNQWHRKSPSHNTVVVNGRSHTGFGAGQCLVEEPGKLEVRADDVYPGVDFVRRVEILEDGFTDRFEVFADESSTHDLFFHVEAGEVLAPLTEPASLGYQTEGYQHLRNICKVVSPDDQLRLFWNVAGQELMSTIAKGDAEVFLMQSPDNPVVSSRTTMVIRRHGTTATFDMRWTISKGEYHKHRRSAGGYQKLFSQ